MTFFIIQPNSRVFKVRRRQVYASRAMSCSPDGSSIQISQSQSCMLFPSVQAHGQLYFDWLKRMNMVLSMSETLDISLILKDGDMSLKQKDGSSYLQQSELRTCKT